MTSKDVAIYKICKVYMNCHWATSNQRAHPTFHAQKSKEPQSAVAEAEKNVRILCTSVTHFGQGLVSCIASEAEAGKLLAKLD